MVSNRKMKGTAQSMPIGLMYGSTVSIIITLLLSATIAYLILNEIVSESFLGYGVMGTVLLSSTLGAMTASACVKRRRLFTCLVMGSCYFVLLLAVTAMFFGGQYEGMAVTGLLVFGGAGAAALVGGKGEENGRKKRRKNRIR